MREAFTIDRTPNPNCPWCRQKKLHPREPVDELLLHHPDAGDGVDNRNKAIKKEGEKK